MPRIAAIAIGLGAVLWSAAPATAQSSPFAPWDGANPFVCELQDVGTGTDYPDPDADPFCVKFDKTNQNVAGFGIAEFTAQEPARVAAASPKCFYFQHDEWTGSVVQGSEPELWHWDGRYFFDKAKGVGGVSVTGYRVGGEKQDATPYVPPEYRPYFDESGGGGVLTTLESDPDPRCVAMVSSEEGRAAVYRDVPRFGRCVAPGGKVRARKVGRARLGARRERVREKVGEPLPPAEHRREGGAGRIRSDSDRWCVVGGGRLRVGYADGRASEIRTTAPGHAAGGVGPGDREDAAVRRAGLRRRERLDRGATVYEAPRRHGRRLLMGARDGRIRWLVLAVPPRPG